MNPAAAKVKKRVAYPAYKPSGMEWLGDVPEHWDIHRLKRDALVQFSSVDKHTVEGEVPVQLCNYVNVYYNDYITREIDFMTATATESEQARFKLRKGDVLVTKDSESWDDIAIPAYVSEDLDNVLCGYHLAHIRPKNGRATGKYLFRAFYSRSINDQFRVAANGITRFGLGKYHLDNSLFPAPPIEEQEKIASFLDRETARIDALIEKKQRQIELLQEKRAALISHAVTKGLDPNVPMKESGIEWLGQIPKHWDVIRLKFVFPTIYSGVSVNADNVPAENNQPAVLKTSCVYGNRFDPKENKRVVEMELDRVACPVTRDSLIISRMNTPELVGNCGYVDKEYHNLFLPDRLWIARFSGFRRTHGKYVWYLMISQALREMTAMLATGTSGSMKNLAQDKFLDINVAMPPLSEQCRIAKFMENTISQLDLTNVKINKSIQKLQEYRTALISAAVTGKIDVRGEAA